MSIRGNDFGGGEQREILCCHGDVKIQSPGDGDERERGDVRLGISCVYSASSPAVSAEKVTLLVYDHRIPVGFVILLLSVSERCPLKSPLLGFFKLSSTASSITKNGIRSGVFHKRQTSKL